MDNNSGVAEEKKVALIALLKILKTYSDKDHPMSQEALKNKIFELYNITVERKKISRDIVTLEEAGYLISHDEKKGYYLEEREFEDSELHLLIDAVLGCRNITPTQSKNLINKICNLSSQYFKSRAKTIHAKSCCTKPDNAQLFYNIETIDNAITWGRQISYTYNKYKRDKKLHKTSEWVMHPYAIILNNQRYYLVGYTPRYDSVKYHRLDHIKDIEILDGKIIPITRISGYEHGIDYESLTQSTPYMYSDKPEHVTLLADEGSIDQIIDWFGKNITIMPYDEKRVKVDLNVSPTAMSFWAMQYSQHVEVIAPTELRKKIKNMLESAMERYKKL